MHIQWTNELSLDAAELDPQHQELFRQAARLLHALEKGKPGDVLELITSLHAHVTARFGAEEVQMQELGYPGYLRHKAEHDRFVTDLALIARDVEGHGRGPGVSPFPVGRWLTDWLKEHVGGTDAELGRYTAKRSASA